MAGMRLQPDKNKRPGRRTHDPRSLALALVLACLAGCEPGPAPAAQSSPPVPAPGAPLPGLTAAELARFEEGLALFDKVFTPEEGLGPFFNENQCSACHTDPASGGNGEQFALRMTRFEAPDRCDLLPAAGGENVQTNATPALAATGVARRPEPAAATERGLFFVPFLFGLGLVEAIPARAIELRADPDDRDGDGVSGRVGRDAAGGLARFGRKAEHPTIDSFVAGALLLEMGITSPVHPTETLLDGRPWSAEIDPVADPEMNAAGLARLGDFVRFLAPLAQRVLPETRADVERGEQLFERVGCPACHTPEFVTGPSPVAALDRKPVRLYSDLLLHDMGPELAGACGIAASPAEYRTEPLMGVGYRRQYLHDGRALDLIEAILMHGGEAVRARDAFAALDRVSQERLVQFLRSL